MQCAASRKAHRSLKVTLFEEELPSRRDQLKAKYTLHRKIHFSSIQGAIDQVLLLASYNIHADEGPVEGVVLGCCGGPCPPVGNLRAAWLSQLDGR
jgi:hypothetical protein